MRLLRSKLFWSAAFGAVFALSIDLWAWGWTGPGLFGLPYTIAYVFLLEGALFVLFALFIAFFWTDSAEEGG